MALMFSKVWYPPMSLNGARTQNAATYLDIYRHKLPQVLQHLKYGVFKTVNSYRNV